MSNLVSPTAIEKIVGVKRHMQAHFGRADSASETIYILHSQRCLDSGIDLRECRFSIAMDSGIEPQVWDDLQDRPIILGVEHGCLVPIDAPRSTPGKAKP